MVVDLVKKELNKIKDKKTKLLFLRRVLRRVKDKNVKKEVRNLINGLEGIKKPSIKKEKPKKEEKEPVSVIETSTLREDFLLPEVLEEPVAVRPVGISEDEEDEIKYEPHEDLERRIGFVTSGEEEEEEKKEVKYILTKDIYQAASEINESALYKAVKDDLRLQKTISRDHVSLSSQEEGLVKDEVRRYLSGASEERIIAESMGVTDSLKYQPERDITTAEDKILEDVGLKQKKKEKSLYRDEGIV